MTSNRIARDLAQNGYGVRNDYGDGKVLYADMSNVTYSLVVAGTETRILASPQNAGIHIAVVYSSGSGTVTISTHGTEKIYLNGTAYDDFTLGAVGEVLYLQSVRIGTQYHWFLCTDAYTTWDDMQISLVTARVPAAAAPDWTQFIDNGAASTGVFAYAFDPTTVEQLYFEVQFSHKLKQGSTVYPHVHWSASANESDVQVSWGLEYTSQDPFGVFPNTTIIYGDEHLQAGNLVAKTHYITPLGSGITDFSDSVSRMVIGRIFRDATGAGGTDDCTNDVFGLSLDFHYESDSRGSREFYEK